MPIKTYQSDGITTIFDSDAVRGGICVGQYSVPAGTSFSKSFPLLQGATLRVTACLAYRNKYGSGSWIPTVNNTGVPSVSATPVSYDRNILIWATGVPSVGSGGGMAAVSGDGTVALSPNGRGLAYIGKASYITQVPTGTSGGFTDMGYWKVQISWPTLPIGIVDMSGGVGVTVFPAFHSIGTNLWEAIVCATATPWDALTPPTSLATPDVYCFALPSTPTTAPVCALYDTDGTLAYDLRAGRMLTSRQFVSLASADIIAALPASPIATTIPPLSRVGVFGVPDYERRLQRGANSANYFRGFWTVSGTSLIFDGGLVERDNDSGTVSTTETSNGGYAEVIDLSGL